MLSLYYDADAEPEPGTWAYLKKIPRGAPTGRRTRAPTTDDADDAPPRQRARVEVPCLS